MCLYRETVPNMLLMIQPSLLAYSLQEQPQAVLLDIASVNPNRILLLDSFFIVLVFYGEVGCSHSELPSPSIYSELPSPPLSSLRHQVIAQWRDAGYHLQPDYIAFAQLLQSAPSDAFIIMRDRFPAARFIECDQNSSQVQPHKLHVLLAHDMTLVCCLSHTLSQARFLTARVNPSVTQSSTG